MAECEIRPITTGYSLSQGYYSFCAVVCILFERSSSAERSCSLSSWVKELSLARSKNQVDDASI